MIAAILDAEILRGVRPAEAAAYLRSHAWKQTSVVGEKATVWTKSAGDAGEYEILLPMDSTLRDYARRIAEALQTLQVAEARSQIAIARDIAAATADMIRIRLQHGRVDNGTVPLKYAAQMIEQTQKLMLAAACAAIEPRALYSGRKPARALAYVRSLRMGPTEQGSFILNVQSPVAPYLQANPDVNGETWEGETPFARRVTLTLADALAATHKAINAAAASGAFEPFDAAIQSGVSANLCGALAMLGMDDTAEAIGIAINWSSSRPAAAEIPAQFRFGRDAFPLLREAARLLRERDYTYLVPMLAEDQPHSILPPAADRPRLSA